MLYRKFDAKKYERELKGIFQELFALEKIPRNKLKKILSKYPKDGDSIFSKDQLIHGFEYLKKKSVIAKDKRLPEILKMKPTRTISGVTIVTVLTKPFHCPGKCIFCPNDIRMPKSYIATEPGAQRALNNRFSPYSQVYNRLKALHQIGHPTEKIELIVLGGTWSYYPRNYQVWFIKECFRALNDFDPKHMQDLSPEQVNKNKFNTLNEQIREQTGAKTYNDLIKTKEYKEKFSQFITQGEKAGWEDLYKQQEKNEKSRARCVGLVLETRPDRLNPEEVLILRKFGATKIQIGVQTLNEKVNTLNKRLESKKQISNAFKLLRAGGFKIHAHIMPNLYGATPEIDRESYKELFNSENFKPDELKIYPTSIIKYTELHDLFKEGKYKPYDLNTLTDLLADCIEMTPEYCRLTRIVRDIPSTEIEAGNKRTNLRELVENKLKAENRKNENIRAREIRGEIVTADDLHLNAVKYKTVLTNEFFLQYITKENKIAGFLRLSIPNKIKNINPITKELDNSAIIREIHVYGPSLNLGKGSTGEAQHLGLGTKLIEEAKKITKDSGFKNLAVISAIGTREYYRKRGFVDGELYQFIRL